MQAVRVTDAKVLDVPMQPVKDVKTASGVSSPSGSGSDGAGGIFAISQNGDNALIALRYRLKDADIQIAEEPFESGGTKFTRGSFVIRNVAHADLEKAADALGLKAHAAPVGALREDAPARAARVAILHQWTNTQTEGWWRQAFDVNGIPYDYIDPEAVRKTADLRAKYDVIVFGPGGGQGAVEGVPMWLTAIPYRNSPETPNVGTWAQTEDTRIGMGLEGLIHLRQFIDAGGVFVASNSSAEFAIANNFSYGVSLNRPGTGSRVVGSLLRTRIADDTSPIVYGVPDNLAMYSDSGESYSVSANVGGGGRGAGGAAAGGGGGAAADLAVAARPAAERRTIRTSSRDARRTTRRTCRPRPRRHRCSPGNTSCRPTSN